MVILLFGSLLWTGNKNKKIKSKEKNKLLPNKSHKNVNEKQQNQNAQIKAPEEPSRHWFWALLESAGDAMEIM